jgi:hypothetical protein
MPDQQHGAGHLVVVDGVEDDGIEDGEFRIAWGLGGGRRRQMGKQADNKPSNEGTRVQTSSWGN